MDFKPVTKTAAPSGSVPIPVTSETFITPIFNKINDIYLKKTYLERYGGSVIFAIFTILIVFFYFIYLNIKNDKEGIKKDWANNRCNPKYLPFAGVIMEPKDMTATEYTIKNLSECSEIILKDIIQIMLAPIEAASILISASISILTGISKSLMAALAYYRQMFLKKQSKDAIERQASYSSILTKLVTKIQSALGKGEGILVTVLYVFFSAYQAGASVFHVILWGEYIILAIMMGILLGLWLMFALYVLVSYFFPLNGIWAIPLSMKFLIGAIILTCIYLAFAIMIIVLLIFTKQVIDNTKGTPVKSYTGETPNLDEYEEPD